MKKYQRIIIEKLNCVYNTVGLCLYNISSVMYKYASFKFHTLYNTGHSMKCVFLYKNINLQIRKIYLNSTYKYTVLLLPNAREVQFNIRINTMAYILLVKLLQIYLILSLKHRKLATISRRYEFYRQDALVKNDEVGQFADQEPRNKAVLTANIAKQKR